MLFIDDTGEKWWCEWVNDECVDGGSCNTGAEEEDTGTVAASPGGLLSREAPPQPRVPQPRKAHAA